ncbi:shikimate dehydrogenase [Microbacterium sp. C7(2022)]|nr:shikimate dehydrogenase [Microbacterium sp. C7(2022)]
MLIREPRTRNRLAVWGDPIAHSQSPSLHAAAYRALGLEWTYERRRVDAASFAGVFAERDDTWRGLSLTMPLKSLAFHAADSRDAHSELTGVANTLAFDSEGAHAFNTDVGGLRRSLEEDGVSSVTQARIVGAGATAMSALIALNELGATQIDVVARREAAVADLARVAARLGTNVRWQPFTTRDYEPVAVTVATLPGGAAVAAADAAALAESAGHLVDVVYGHWPSTLATAWIAAGGSASSGRGMLLHQALLQVRIFVHGEGGVALDDEEAVLADMRAALVGD